MPRSSTLEGERARHLERYPPQRLLGERDGRPEGGKIDFADKSVTENTRVSYPINFNPFHSPPKVIFLSPPPLRVLLPSRPPPPRPRSTSSPPSPPPVPRSRLPPPSPLLPPHLSSSHSSFSPRRRIFLFLLPSPPFFLFPFLVAAPTKYGEELVKRMKKSGAKAYLVNTGWKTGAGKRISIKDTRGIIDAILDGSIDKAKTKKLPIFDFEIPTALPGVDPARSSIRAIPKQVGFGVGRQGRRIWPSASSRTSCGSPGNGEGKSLGCRSALSRSYRSGGAKEYAKGGRFDLPQTASVCVVGR